MGNYNTPEYHGVAQAAAAAAVDALDAEELATVRARTAQEYFAAAELTSASASIAWDLDAAQVAVHNATEDTTLANPTNMQDGGKYTFIFIQHASSAKTLAFGSAYAWAGGTAPTVSVGASAVDIMEFDCYDGIMHGKIRQASAVPA
jgi:hypothetical protein